MENITRKVTRTANGLNSSAMCYLYLGIEIGKLKERYYYKALIKYLQGNDDDMGSLYLSHLKPLYDAYGYETVNCLLLAFEEADRTKELEEKEQTNE